MKKIILILSVLLFTVSFSNSNAQCPSPQSLYDGPYNVTYQFGPDCFVEASYCIFTGITITGTPNIHFSDFIITGSCSSIAWSSNGPVIPWNQLIGFIISKHSTSTPGLDQFKNVSIPHCDDTPTSRPIVRIFSGGCYDYHHDSIEGRHYWTPCSANGSEECHQEYTLCRYFDLDSGSMRVKVVSGPISPSFTCPDENCSPLCSQLSSQ
jgi:hypothetical protein